jgi:hypothetical protein
LLEEEPPRRHMAEEEEQVRISSRHGCIG